MRTALESIRTALKEFPSFKTQFESSERKRALVRLRRVIGYIQGDIETAAKDAGVSQAMMTHEIYQPGNFTFEEWDTLQEALQFIQEHRSEIFSIPHKTPSTRNERIKI